MAKTRKGPVAEALREDLHRTQVRFSPRNTEYPRLAQAVQPKHGPISPSCELAKPRYGEHGSPVEVSGMAKQQPKPRQKPALILRVSGPQIRSGRIPVPDLLVICQHAQAAVSRQAEALEGRQTLRPGPKIGRVRLECTLELVSLGSGSATLGFDQAKPQPNLPPMGSLGDQAIATVAQAIQAIAKGKAENVDPGVLDSLRSMGELFQNGVRSVQWIVPARGERKRITANFNRAVQTRIVKRLRPPMTQHVSVDGVLEMVDFKPSDQKCRIHPTLGPAINCTFSSDLADLIYAVLRKAARIEGNATINIHTGKTENIHITAVTPLDPLTVNAGTFFKGLDFSQLAHLQAVDPLPDASVLAGGWPDDEDPDEILAEIYQRRE